MRYQKPHDYSAKEQIFITVEADDTTDTFVRGNFVSWHLVDESVNFTAGNLPAFNTQGYRVLPTPAAATALGAGFVETLPPDNGGGVNHADTRPGGHFDIQVYGFHDAGLCDDAANWAAGDLLEGGPGAVGGLTQIATPGNFVTVGFAFEVTVDTFRGPIFIRMM